MYHARDTFTLVTHEPNDTPAPEPSEATPAEEAAPEKKERVLHTRVPAVLERELKRFAENLRMPVSNLVRTILEDAVAAADKAGEGVEGQLKRMASHLEEERKRLHDRLADARNKELLASALAFQPVRLAKPTACAQCGRDCAAGEQAHLIVGEPDSRERAFVCAACVPPA
jgi:hypothetical protein